MKTLKYYSLIIVIGLITLFGFSTNLSAQCPPGFTPKTVNMVVGGCTYTMEICVSCSPLGAGATKVKIISGPTLVPTSPPCSPTIPLSGVVNYVMAHIQNPAFVFNELCPWPVHDAPPCNGPEPPKIVKYYIPQCWEAEVIMYFGEKAVTFKSCSDDICELTYEVCVDGNGEYQETLLSKIGTSTPSCTVEAFSISFPDPENLGLFPVGHKTPCYIYHSLCNP